MEKYDELKMTDFACKSDGKPQNSFTSVIANRYRLLFLRAVQFSSMLSGIETRSLGLNTLGTT